MIELLGRDDRVEGRSHRIEPGEIDCRTRIPR
jgi:hypothetical protein